MKKVLTLLLSTCMLLCVVVGLAACEEKGCNHSYSERVAPPTCTKQGYTTFTCDLCGDSYVGNYVDARHSYQGAVTDPTCTEQGYTTFTCDLCGDSYVDDYVDARHSYGAWIDEIPADCEKDGTLGHYHCSVCEKDFDANKKELTSLIAISTGHSYENGYCKFCDLPEVSYKLKFKLSDDGTHYIVTGIEDDCLEKNIIIPAEHNELPVTEIGELAFYQCTQLESVTILDTVEIIGNYAFKECSNLESVILSTSLTKIGAEAFRSCGSLTDIDLPEGLCEIGTEAFWNCKALSTVTFPDSLTTIGVGTFRDCIGLESVIFGSGLLEVPDYSFQRCSSLVSISNQEGISRLGSYAFADCSNLSEATFPNVTFIGNRAFSKCNKLKKLIVGPNGLVGESAFESCAAIEIATIPASLIGVINTSALTSLVINAGEGIPANALNDCSKLTSVTLPATIKSIGERAFNGSAITDVYYNGTIAEWCNIDFASYYTGSIIPYYSTPMYVGSRFYILTDGEYRELTELTVPDGVTEIKSGAFYSFDNLTSVTVSDTVLTIGDQAFAKCSLLSNIEFGNSIKTIKTYAFMDCDLITSVILPESIKTVDDGIFSNCDNLEKLTFAFPDEENKYFFSSINPINDKWLELTIVGTNAIPAESISSNKIRKVTIGNGVPSIGDYAFNCSNLYEVEIGEGVTSIGYYPFKNCASLNYARYDNAFYLGNETNPYMLLSHASSSSITSCNINENTRFINSGAFSNCRSLKTMIVPDSVMSIGGSAFAGSGLNELTLGSGLERIGSLAFDSCSFSRVSIPNSVKYIGENAFRYSNALFYCEATSKPEGWAESWSTSENVLWGYGGTYTENGLLYMLVGNEYYVVSYTDALGTELVIPSEINERKVTAIYANAFSSCRKITSVSIPNTITFIGEGAFQSCKGIASIVIPNSVTVIGNNAFSACSNLTEATLPENITAIPDTLFGGCEMLKAIVIPQKVESIGNYAFQGCSGLRSVSIPDATVSIGDYAFYQCESLNSLTLGTGLKTIGKRAFDSCYGVSELVLPDGLTTIGEYAFYNFGDLTSLYIPASVSSVGYAAFPLSCTIYCEADSKPEGWDSNWNINPFYESYAPVVWNSKKEN